MAHLYENLHLLIVGVGILLFHAYHDGKVARFGWISAAVAWSCLLMTDLAALIK